LIAVETDANGNRVPGATVRWTSSNDAVATVDGEGLVRAVGGGGATITATVQGASGTASVAVTAPVLAPASLIKVSGDNQKGANGRFLDAPLVVEVRDAAGAPVAGVLVRWDAKDGFADPVESRTDALGRASTRWDIGGGAPTLVRRLEASLPNHPSVAPITFTAERG
jgi:hypothetical protein